jgi:NAD(P)H dehydrogenase (quinone)
MAGPRWAAWLMGDPPRKLIKRQLRHLIQPRAKVRYLPLYAIDASSQAMRERFLAKVERAMAAF